LITPEIDQAVLELTFKNLRWWKFDDE
jgi:hypothetical protein